MTYRPVDNPSGRGRKPIPIPPTLLTQLRHTFETKTRATADLTGIPAEDVDELRRALTRAGYRHFRDRSVRVELVDDPPRITYWLTDKRAPGKRRKKR